MIKIKEKTIKEWIPLEKIYKDTDIMTGLQDVANEMNGLNKRLDSNASDKIINMLANKDSD